MPLQRRLPKRGFHNIFKKHYAVIHLKDLMRFPPESAVDVESLVQAGLVKKPGDGVKLLADGNLSHPLIVKVHSASKVAREKVEAAGGKIEIL